MNPNQNDKMHPDDNRNLIIFMVVSVLLYFAYDALILGPQKEALRQSEVAQTQLLEMNAPEGSPVNQQLVALGLAPASEPRPRDEVLTETSRLHIDNGAVFGSINLTGGRIDDVSFTEYFDTKAREKHVNLLSPSDTQYPRSIEYGWVTSDSTINLPNKDTRWSIRSGSALSAQRPVTLSWNNGGGITFERELSIDDNYLISMTQRVINNSGQNITLYPYGLIAQKGLPKGLENRWLMHEGPTAYMGDELVEFKYKKLRKEPQHSYQANTGWIGIGDKYWLTALIPPQGQSVKYRFNYQGIPPQKGQPDTGNYQVDFTGSALSLASGQSGEVSSHVLIGAKKVIMLKKYNKELGIRNLDLSVDFGMFWFLTVPFFYMLHFLGELVGNMGVAIILLTIIIRTAASPLTYISYKSFAKMKKVTPQVNALREEHGDDKKKLQVEMMQLYQREGVNPMAGCFPILLQIPIFFAFYKILFITLEIRHAPFFGWIQDLSAPDPTSIFNLFGIIPWDPPGFLMIGVWPCLMLIGMNIQRKLNPPPQDPLQRDMAMYFPFLMAFMMAQFASGLVIYWTISAYFGIIQQSLIMRKMGVPIHLFGETEEEKELEDSVKEGESSGHPLIKMAEDEIEDAVFEEHSDEDCNHDGDDEPPKPKISKPKPKKKKKKK